MSSSDDDVPLAVVAEKVKQKSEVVDKRPKKDVKKRKIETDSSESESEESDRDQKRRRRKKRKPPLEDEFDSDEIPLGEMSGDGDDNADEKASHDGESTEVHQEESSSKKINEKGGEGEVVNRAGSESGSDKEGSKPSTSSPDNTETKKDDLETEKKRNFSIDSSSRDSVRSKNKSSSSSADESDKEISEKANSKGEKEGKEKRSEDNGSEKPNRRKKMSRKEEKTMKHHGSSSEEDEEETEEKKKSGKKGRPKKEKKNEALQDAASIRLAKLKKMVTLAGFRIVYKKFFEDVGDSDRQRVKALEKELERRGLTPPFTMESCKAFKLQKEQEAELAELAKNQIIEIGENTNGRVTRGQRSAALASKRRGGIIFEGSSDEDEELEEREHMKEETRNMFKNLRGIVSDDADSD